MIFWGFILGLPLFAYGGAALFSPEKTNRFNLFFASSRKIAILLTCIAWGWTAHELDIIGIDVFDMLLKRFTGEVWFLAALLAYLTIIWMPKNLSVRALTAILMLFPAQMFRTSRHFLPESGAAPVHIFVIVAYVSAAVGMYGMFYPWRLEKALSIIFAAPRIWPRLFGLALALTGIALLAAGFTA